MKKISLILTLGLALYNSHSFIIAHNEEESYDSDIFGDADDDFNFADANLKENSTFYAQICFHFHQAAEKYLKTFIIAYDLEFEKTHNLVGLLKICSKKEPSILSILEECTHPVMLII